MGLFSFLFKKDVTPIEIKKTAHSIKKGYFEISGYHHLPEEVKKIVWKKLKPGDSLMLAIDPYNKYDPKAIKVYFGDTFIGWVSSSYSRKGELFNMIVEGYDFHFNCKSNYRNADNRTDEKTGLIKYLGMAQFVAVEFSVISNQ